MLKTIFFRGSAFLNTMFWFTTVKPAFSKAKLHHVSIPHGFATAKDPFAAAKMFASAKKSFAIVKKDPKF